MQFELSYVSHWIPHFEESRQRIRTRNIFTMWVKLCRVWFQCDNKSIQADWTFVVFFFSFVFGLLGGWAILVNGPRDPFCGFTWVSLMERKVFFLFDPVRASRCTIPSRRTIAVSRTSVSLVVCTISTSIVSYPTGELACTQRTRVRSHAIMQHLKIASQCGTLAHAIYFTDLVHLTLWVFMCSWF